MARDGLAADHVERRIAAANRIPPSQAAHYRALAKAGTDISYLDTLAAVAVDGVPSSEPPEDDDAVYAALYPTPEQDRKAADKRVSVTAARAAEPASDKDLYEAIFGPGSWEDQ